MRNPFCRRFGFLSLMLVLTPFAGMAQERPQVFSLPEAHAGEAYKEQIEDVLREKYSLKLESGTPKAIIQWSPAGGELPPGMSVGTDGTIVGTSSSRIDEYRFRLKVVDVMVKNDELVLEFSLLVKPGRLRLSKIQGPRLVPVDLRNRANSEGSSDKNGNSLLRANANSSNQTFKPAGDEPKTDTGPKDPAKPADKNEESTNAQQKDIENPFSSLNKRFILGFEQSGAASSDSTGKPFFDIFINTPLSRQADCSPEPCLPPRLSIWGDIRLTSTAEQLKALGNIASTAVETATNGKLNQITSAFDFVVGPDVRLLRFRHTDFSFIAGYGAVSPVSPRQSAQIFQVPDAASSQAPAFYKQYPGAQGKQFIAFISPDRDRFLRQYFGGFRFKSFTYDGKALQKVFPATFDVTFGQSEAVTGGRLHKFVVGLDGFYPLPFPDNSRFLYLFGSARFKAGGPKTITTPFILDTAASSVNITDPKVFIADPTPTNRDTYRIGFGVDLVELFKFAKAQGAKQQREDSKAKP